MSQSGTSVSNPTPQCSTEGCERTDLIKKAGVCRRCYQLVRAGRDPANPLRNRQHGDTCTWPGGCDEPYRARGLCQKHYDESRRGLSDGSERLEVREPRKPTRTPEEALRVRSERLWSKVDKRGPGECWPWTGCIGDGGYGQISWPDGAIGVHRAAYIVTYGPVPEFPGDRTEIDHTCHDPDICKLKTKCPHRRCCNPAHLEAVPRRVNLERSDRSRPGNGRASSACEFGCTCDRHLSTACAPGCTCGRHRSGSCEPGCTCGRHRGHPGSSVECEPGCTCGKHRAARAKCEMGCTCGRHKRRAA